MKSKMPYTERKRKYPSKKEIAGYLAVNAPTILCPPHFWLPNGNIAPENQVEPVIFILTVGGEARGESKQGQELVASVILNRWLQQTWFGRTVNDVCLKHGKNDNGDYVYQFDCWNPQNKNYKWIAKPEMMEYQLTALSILPIYFQQKPIVNGDIDHYYNPDLCSPSWADVYPKIMEEGQHRFYSFRKWKSSI